MIAFLARLFSRPEPSLGEATSGDAAALAQLHAASFRRGWSEHEFERLLLDRTVLAHRAKLGRHIAGFIISRCVADEAEILSIAVSPRQRGHRLGTHLLELHLRRLAGRGVRTLFLEVEEQNAAARRMYARAGFRQVGQRVDYYPQQHGKAAAAVVLRRDLT